MGVYLESLHFSAPSQSSDPTSFPLVQETAFYAQLPLLVISLICLFILLPRPAHLSHHHHKRTSLLSSLDLPGTTLLLLSVGSLLLALSIHTSGFAWGDIRVAGLLVTAVLATVLFVVVERGREIAGVRVLVAWEVFGQKSWSAFPLSSSFDCLLNFPLFCFDRHVLE